MRLGRLLTVTLTLGWSLAHAQADAPSGRQEGMPLTGPEGVLLATHSVSGIVPVKSWKRLRDDRVVKQDLDYSCGAASLATLLNNFYGLDVCHIPDDHKAFDGTARGWI